LNAKGKVDDKDGKETPVDKFSIGELTGIKMAIDVMDDASDGQFRAGGGFRRHDLVTFDCTGIRKAEEKGQSDMPEFVIIVKRA